MAVNLFILNTMLLNWQKQILIIHIGTSLLFLQPNAFGQSKVENFFESLPATQDTNQLTSKNYYCDVFYNDGEISKTFLQIEMARKITYKNKGYFLGQTDKISSISKFVILEFDFKKNKIVQIGNELDFFGTNLKLIGNKNYLYAYSALTMELSPIPPVFHIIDIRKHSLKTFKIIPPVPFYEYILDFKPIKKNKQIVIKTQVIGSSALSETTTYKINEKNQSITPIK